MDSNIFGIGMNELIVIFVLAAIVLGPERMVRVARQAGKHIRNLKAYFSSLTEIGIGHPGRTEEGQGRGKHEVKLYRKVV
jgi:Sec-independent protein translocase protein TatA